MNVLLPETTFRAAVQILKEECSNVPDCDDFLVEQFTTQPWGEWRFCGNLGFGGKLYFSTYPHRNPDLYVDCYPEDNTPERAALIQKVNLRLAELLKFLPESTVT